MAQSLHELKTINEHSPEIRYNDDHNHKSNINYVVHDL